jgi:hypothetical protein
MTSRLPSGDSDRVRQPADFVKYVGARFPGIWPELDRLRGALVTHFKDFPAHWYLPFHAIAHTMDSVLMQMGRAGLNPPRITFATVNMVATIAAWRVTQGVYRFDATLFDALIATPVSGPLPTDLLSRLPEWTVYIETPGMQWGGEPLRGVFAQVAEMDDGTECLYLALNVKRQLYGFLLRLDQPSLEASLDMATHPESRAELGISESDVLEVLPRIVSLLLYLCSESAELGDGTRLPPRPVARRTKKGMRMFPAERQTTWDVGMRMGAALRLAYRDDEEQRTSGSGAHASPRPHIRRAHWHTFLSGARQNPTRTLRWLPPIPVNVERIEDLVPTIRPVALADALR